MKAKKARKRLVKVESLLAEVIEHLAPVESGIRHLLDSAKSSVVHAALALARPKSAKDKAAKAKRAKQKAPKAKAGRKRSSSTHRGAKVAKAAKVQPSKPSSKASKAIKAQSTMSMDTKGGAEGPEQRDPKAEAKSKRPLVAPMRREAPKSKAGRAANSATPKEKPSGMTPGAAAKLIGGGEKAALKKKSSTRGKPAPGKKLAAKKKALAPKKPAAKKKLMPEQKLTPKKELAAEKKAVLRKKKPIRHKKSSGRTKQEITNPVSLRGRRGVGSASGGQSGDTQGLSRVEDADSESVEELLEEGQYFEAEAVSGVENAKDPDESEVTTSEFPEDDVPPEYTDRNKI